jgi:hypothetical protein
MYLTIFELSFLSFLSFSTLLMGQYFLSKEEQVQKKVHEGASKRKKSNK